VGTADPVSEERLLAPAPLPLADDDLAIFVLNVGDGDAIVIRFPADGQADGQGVSCAVIDSFNGAKTVALLHALEATHLRFVCATHPHWDHISGLRRVLAEFAGRVDEFWDSGFRFTSTTYRSLMEEVQRQSGPAGRLRVVRPTSGFEVFHAGASLTVLSPSVALRNRYDTYGVDVNNASIVVRLTYPVPPPSLQYPLTNGEEPEEGPPGRTAILGGDAQTDAWASVLGEFPHLDPDPRIWARAIGAKKGRQPLACDFFKVSHHGSKRGVNLELLERLGDRAGGGPSTGARIHVISCASGSGSVHGFPHTVTQGLLREVRSPQAKSGGQHPSDDRLGIHYTSQAMAPAMEPAGSVAYVMGADGRARLYRLGDAPAAPATLDRARLVR
jgi:beta-lactamase superfamily II metal-dependent hydrolase